MASANNSHFVTPDFPSQSYLGHPELIPKAQPKLQVPRAEGDEIRHRDESGREGMPREPAWCFSRAAPCSRLSHLLLQTHSPGGKALCSQRAAGCALSREKAPKPIPSPLLCPGVISTTHYNPLRSWTSFNRAGFSLGNGVLCPSTAQPVPLAVGWWGEIPVSTLCCDYGIPRLLPGP